MRRGNQLIRSSGDRLNVHLKKEISKHKHIDGSSCFGADLRVDPNENLKSSINLKKIKRF